MSYQKDLIGLKSVIPKGPYWTMAHHKRVLLECHIKMGLLDYGVILKGPWLMSYQKDLIGLKSVIPKGPYWTMAHHKRVLLECYIKMALLDYGVILKGP